MNFGTLSVIGIANRDMIKKVKSLLKKFSWSAVLITRASDGMTLVEQATETHFPARTRDVYDTSGAGDTVISVLGASVSSGFTLKDSVGLSNIAAGIVVENFGVTSISGPELREGGLSDTKSKPLIKEVCL